MRAVIYARYSSENQNETSLEDQARLCRAFADRQGWTYLHAYTDRAISGASALRAGYQKLLEDARAKRFEVVVAEALDRLSRDQADVASLYKDLTFLGIKLITLAEGEISELHVGLKGTMNALYLKDLAQKTWRGLEGRVRQGRSGGGLCYGYDVVQESGTDGDTQHGKRRINEAEAAVVRRIFAEFSAGKSPRAIARDLNAERMPGPKGRPWRDTAIRGHVNRGTGIINNELYVGRLVWNRLRYVKDPRTVKRLSRLNRPDGWIARDVAELRIVDDDLWHAVKRRQKVIAAQPGVIKARESRFWEHRRKKHLLTGLVRCGSCGSPVAAVGRDYLACSAARGRGTCGNARGIRRVALEGLILEALKARLMAPELVQEFIAAFTEEVNRHRRHAELERQARQRELVEVSRRVDGLIEAIADGLRTAGLKAKLDELEARKAALEAEMAEAPPPAPRPHPNLAKLYRRKVETLREALEDPSMRDEALDLLRSLVERVGLSPIEGGFEIELVGEIANMVALAAESCSRNEKAAPGGAAVPEVYRCSVKVVAGERNQRYLQAWRRRIPRALSS